jgi:hypothetical protein
MARYTLYLVTRNRDHHYPVFMANNGKAMLNEPVARARVLQRTAERLADAILEQQKFMRRKKDGTPVHFDIVRISEKDFRAKFPKFAPNKGGRKKVVKGVVRAVSSKGFRIGDIVVCDKKHRETTSLTWEAEMNDTLGKPFKVQGIDVDGNIETSLFAYDPKWLRHATPSEVKAYNKTTK